MIRWSIILLLISLLQSCDSSSASDCFQAQGNQITERIELDSFTKISLGDGVKMVLKQGDEQEVLIQTGENLLPEISLGVVDGTLVITDGNDCNFVRDYGGTTVFVTAPDITEIRNASRWEIRSEGVLNYPQLRLLSGTNPELKSGDFYMSLNSENLTVIANGVSVFYLNGEATNCTVRFTDEQPRFEGAQLNIQQLTVFQRSANDMIVNPLQSISGEIRGTGNVIAKNRPEVVDVQEFFTGRLIFED